MTTYMVQKRRKEIGVRKILGASIQGIMGLLTSDFVRTVHAELSTGKSLGLFNYASLVTEFCISDRNKSIYICVSRGARVAGGSGGRGISNLTCSHS